MGAASYRFCCIFGIGLFYWCLPSCNGSGIDNYFALHRHTGHLFSRKSNQIKIRKGKCDHEYKKIHQKLTASLLFIAVVMSFGVQSAFAESNSPKATVKNNVVTFSNLDQLKANEKLAIAVVDSNGDPATITIESVDNSISRVAKSSNSWKVSYKGVVIHAYFYMTVTNNKVTNAWDYSITTLCSTYSDASLTYNSSSAKLTFTSNAYNGIASHTCWLKGTPRGTNNEVDVTYSM